MTDRTDRKNGQTSFLAAVLTAIYAYMIEEQYTEGLDQDFRLVSWKLTLRDESYSLQRPAKFSGWKRGKLITFSR